MFSVKLLTPTKAHKARLATRKVKGIDADGYVCKSAASSASMKVTWWRLVERIEAESWPDFARALVKQGKANEDVIAVQAELLPGADSERFRKASLPKGDLLPGMAPGEQQMLVLDFDGANQLFPFDEDPSVMMETVIKELPKLLPGFDRSIPFVMQLSSSHGLRKRSPDGAEFRSSNIRLWLPLRRALPQKELHGFIQACNARYSHEIGDSDGKLWIDPACHASCGAIYIADPLFQRPGREPSDGQDLDIGLPRARWHMWPGEDGSAYQPPASMLGEVRKVTERYLDQGGDPSIAPGELGASETGQALLDRDLVIGKGPIAGSWCVQCPNSAQHTTDSGPTETVFYQAGAGGRVSEGFKCFHAHCSDWNVHKLREFLGLQREGFEDVVRDMRDNWIGIRAPNGKDWLYMPVDGNPAEALSRSALGVLQEGVARRIVGPRGGISKRYPVDVVLGDADFRHVVGETFVPGGPPLIDAGRFKLLNRWVEPKLEQYAGQTATNEEKRLWEALLDVLFPEPANRRWVIDWLAHMVQHPAERPSIHLYHISEKTGLGRGTFGEIVIAMLNLGRLEHQHVAGRAEMKHFLKDFNGPIAQKEFLMIEELSHKEGSLEGMSRLRDVMTRKKVTVNRKYRQEYEATDISRLMICTNHTASLDIIELDRRVLAVHVPGGFPKLERADYGALAAMHKSTGFLLWLRERLLAHEITQSMFEPQPKNTLPLELRAIRKSPAEKVCLRVLEFLDQHGIDAVDTNDFDRLAKSDCLESGEGGNPLSLAGNYRATRSRLLSKEGWAKPNCDFYAQNGNGRSAKRTVYVRRNPTQSPPRGVNGSEGVGDWLNPSEVDKEQIRKALARAKREIDTACKADNQAQQRRPDGFEMPPKFGRYGSD
jgi:hypothetical protein